MGVPSFYRWLVNKYPKIVVETKEDKGKRKIDDECVMIDTSLPNPNGIEFDNLYLDMNGIIHPCFHPDQDDHLSHPQTFEDVFESIFDYIDNLFQIVRPRKLLYMAIDGVAPRAKMNQQRSRRFKTSKDSELAEVEEARLIREFHLEGKNVLPKKKSEIFDSNIITPGTVFMHDLSKSLQSYIKLRLKNDNGWKDIKVILSDSNVPGEGEHKIMSFIRMQRTFPDYDPETRHCIYGLDADLIMLVLATHEVHFSILREDILIPERPSYQTTQKLVGTQVDLPKNVYKCFPSKPYQFLHIWILREYLELDMNIQDPLENMKIDLERIIDDFIFICFFTGNDFLPHMPSLEIHEGAIDLLMRVYKTEFKKVGGYLVDMQLVGDQSLRCINLKRVEKFILSIGQKEELIFKKRTELRDRKLRRLLSEHYKVQEQDDGESPIDFTSLSLSTSSGNTMPSNGTSNSHPNLDEEMVENTKELKARLKSWSHDRQDLFKDGSFMVDKVRFGAPGWKQRYYMKKFSAETKEEIENTRKALVQNYTEGLCWVLLYYFSGVPSWTWFYNYYYGPFASDLRGMSSVKVKFENGLPFKPFDQLMGVLPPRSALALPKSYRELMTHDDSNIQDFYPLDFEVDTDGKRFLWQGICKLPFIDEKRLTTETKKLEVELTDDEVMRNCTKNDLLYVRSSNKLGPHIYGLYRKQFLGKCTHISKESIPADLSCGINGSISPLDEADVFKDTNDIGDDSVICVRYELPNGGHHVPRPLGNIPERTIYEGDITETQLWHEHPGSRPNYRPRSQYSNHKVNEGQTIDWKKSNEGAIHKYGGTGWSSSGRGQRCNVGTETCVNTRHSSTYGYVTPRHRSRGRGYQSCGRGDNNNNNIRGPNNVARYGDNNLYHRRTSTTSSDNTWRPQSYVDKYDEQMQQLNCQFNSTSRVHGRGRSVQWRARGHVRPPTDYK